MAVVETRNLTKIFKEGELGAVNNVNLETREGEFLVFLGPSGSGKTTLLRMIAGLEQPTAGEILIGGRVVNDLSPRERRIAMVFQSYALYPHLSVYNNIAFPLKAQNVKKELRKGKVEWAASLLGISSLLQRKPRELSGVSGKGSPWPGLLSASPRSSCWTSLSPTSTPSSAFRPARSWSAFTGVSAPPPSTSLTIRWKPWPWATVSLC